MAAAASSSSNIKRLTRLDVKALMQQQWGDYLKLLSFPAHLLVISTPQRSNASATVLVTDKIRFCGKRGDYYFIVAYFEHSYDYKVYFLIAHDTVAHLNEESHPNRWRVPLYLCQEETQFMRKTAFTHYQDDEFKVPPGFALMTDPANPNKPSLERALEMRLELYRWFAKDAAFQDANPLDDFALTYARDAPHVKAPDQLCYFLLTKHLTAERYQRWVEGEEALMRHKIYLRPKLGNRVCVMTLPPTMTMANAISMLRKFHQINWERIRQLKWSFLEDPDAKALVDKFFTSLEKEAKEQAEQEAALADAKRILSKKVDTPTVTPKQQIFMGDIRSCAPKCLARLMAAAFGTDKQRARMPDVHRLFLNRILIEHQMTAYDIEDIIRPISMTAYKAENPNRTWEELKDGITTAAQEVDLAAQEGKFHVTCEDMMKWDLCPHLAPTPTMRMSFEDRVKNRKTRFITAKQRCHADLELAREARTLAAPHRGSIDWIKSPWAFTRVAIIGNQANPDRKFKPKKPGTAKVPVAVSAAGAIEYEDEDGAEEKREEEVV